MVPKIYIMSLIVLQRNEGIDDTEAMRVWRYDWEEQISTLVSVWMWFPTPDWENKISKEEEMWPSWFSDSYHVGTLGQEEAKGKEVGEAEGMIEGRGE